MAQAKADTDKIHRFTLNLKRKNYEWARKTSHKANVSISQLINALIDAEKAKTVKS